MAAVTLTITISTKFYSPGELTPGFIVKALEQKHRRDENQKILMRQRRAEGKA